MGEDKNNTPVDKVIEIFEKGYNKQVILYGPPGTSKTYSSTIIAAKILGYVEDDDKEAKEDDKKAKDIYKEAKKYLENEAKERFEIVQFHPSYNYDDFVRGIQMTIPDSNPESIVYEPVDKIFAKFADKANKAIEGKSYEYDSKKNYVLIIDEINRAPLASVLGELIYGLEYRGNNISTPYAIKGKEQIIVPENLYIIGTMNTADRSIGCIDYAVRRRFAFVKLPVDWRVVEQSWKKGLEEKKVDESQRGIIINAIKELWCKINGKTEGIDEENDKQLIDDQSIKYAEDVDPDDVKIGHSYFLYNEEKCNKPDNENIEKYMKYRLEYEIKPILYEYRNDGLLNNSSEEIKNLKFVI
jgi:5-methylcytosine-specific restriction endonuclease McrBC GTP-binding regulatory subunit McrB